MLRGSPSATSRLSEFCGASVRDLGDFAGLMNIQSGDVSILLFRKQFHAEIKWRISKPERYAEGIELPRFSPAGSFEFLIQEFENQSRPWSEKILPSLRLSQDPAVIRSREDDLLHGDMTCLECSLAVTEVIVPCADERVIKPQLPNSV